LRATPFRPSISPDGMRAFALSLAVSLLGCSPAVDYVASDSGGVTSPPSALPESSALVPSSGAAASLPAPELCFAVAPELEAKYPNVRPLATEAAARWGLQLGFCEGAVSRLELADIPNGTHPAARHRPLRMADGSIRSATEGGASLITIDPDAVLTELSAAECSAAWVEGQSMPALLVRVLTHEFGHMLGLDDDPKDYEASMFFSTRLCTDLWPTDAELNAAHAVDHDIVVQAN
jgi:hypothetical protein